MPAIAFDVDDTLYDLADPYRRAVGEFFGPGFELPLDELFVRSRIRSDVSQVYENAIAGTLDKASVDWDARSALGVVCAAEGYPESPKKGAVIESLPENEESLKVFHAGTAWDSEHRMVVNGGRVLCVVGLGATLREAQSRAYEGVKGVRWNGMQHRSDIGWRALK